MQARARRSGLEQYLTWLGHRDDVADLLPALVLLGVGIGLCGPAVQIGALSGVGSGAEGLASGLVETMREIGGAVGIAAVSTVLVARSGSAGPFGAFHTAFFVAATMAAMGALVAAIAFPRVARRTVALPLEVPATGSGVVLVEDRQTA
jgi:hypothetical protein